MICVSVQISCCIKKYTKEGNIPKVSLFLAWNEGEKCFWRQIAFDS